MTAKVLMKKEDLAKIQSHQIRLFDKLTSYVKMINKIKQEMVETVVDFEEAHGLSNLIEETFNMDELHYDLQKSIIKSNGLQEINIAAENYKAIMRALKYERNPHNVIKSFLDDMINIVHEQPTYEDVVHEDDLNFKRSVPDYGILVERIKRKKKEIRSNNRHATIGRRMDIVCYNIHDKRIESDHSIEMNDLTNGYNRLNNLLETKYLNYNDLYNVRLRFSVGDKYGHRDDVVYEYLDIWTTPNELVLAQRTMLKL